MSARILASCVLSCVCLAAACKGDKGDQGDIGPSGPQGPVGPNPVVASSGGMAGDGTSGNPIRIDPTVVPSKAESNRVIETEGSAATGGLGAVQTNAKASGGSIRF